MWKLWPRHVGYFHQLQSSQDVVRVLSFLFVVYFSSTQLLSISLTPDLVFGFRCKEVWENQINQKHCVQSFPWNKPWWVSGNTGISRFSPGRCGKLAADLLLYLAVLIPFSESYKLSIKLSLICVNIHIEKSYCFTFSTMVWSRGIPEWMNESKPNSGFYVF